MQNKQIVLDYSEYDSMEELPIEAQELMEKAIAATDTAYAPYSGFHVGAAARLADGTIVTGSNQENLAYPSGLCAERTALFSASATHPDVAVAALAVVGRTSEGGLTEASPCGACRQVFAEYERRYGRCIDYFFYLDGGRIRRIKGTEKLIPFTFKAKI